MLALQIYNFLIICHCRNCSATVQLCVIINTVPACSEVMQDPSQLPDSRIELSPSNIGSPDSIRGPTAEGWMAKEVDESYITIDFTGQDGASPSTLERIDFFGNLRAVFILVKTTL